MRPREFHHPLARVFDLAKRDGSPFSPLVDAFHPSFPARVEDYISEPFGLNTTPPTHGPPTHDRNCLNAHHYHGQEEEGDLLLGSGNPLFKLPSEVSDLILSYLSPGALDAARHTSKDWRMRILSNTWLLSSVLAEKEKTSPLNGSLSDTLSHRDLLKMLDYNSDLPSTFQHPDAWRTRFRIRTIDFSIPSPSSTVTTPTFVAAVRIGTQNGFIVFQLQDSGRDTGHGSKSTLLIYRFDSADLPWYTGTIHDVEGEGALRIPIVTEIKRHAEWVLKIEIGDTAGLYSLNARQAFSKYDSRFSLKRLESLEEASGLVNANLASRRFDRSPEPLPLGDQFWEVLAPIPPNGGLHHVCLSKGVRKHAESRFLAERVENGNIYVIVEADPCTEASQYARYSQSNSLSNYSEGGNHAFTGTALLSPPRPDSVYKNLAVAPSVTRDGSVRVAIVWQTTRLDRPISELYIYDVPEAVYYEPCRSYSLKTGGNIFATAESLGDGAGQRPCRLVQGKRVTSLDQHMGGIHPSIPPYRFGSPQATALGGLQLPHTTENQEANPRNVQYQKCFVWGPATSEGECTRISVKIFDFSFADPQRLHSLLTYDVRGRQRQNKDAYIVALKSLHCACALHDDGFRVVLPDVTIIEASEPATIKRENPGVAASSWPQKSALIKQSLSFNGSTWSFWPQKPTSIQDCVPNVGTVLQKDSPARAAALDKLQRWLRGRIVGLKRMGLSDFEIAELWNLCDWTRYGQVRKPEGWRELGESDEIVYDG